MSRAPQSAGESDVLPPRPLLSDSGLHATEGVEVADQDGRVSMRPAAMERPLTLVVDGDELVTLMTIGGHPELLTLGYLRNQRLLDSPERVASVRVDWDREVAEVATHDGLGVGSPSASEPAELSGSPLQQSVLYDIVATIPTINRVYRESGSVHGVGLFGSTGLICFVEDVARHNATDIVAGRMWLDRIDGADKVLYSTGRLTTEIVDKVAVMGIPTLVSRNGVTHRAVQLAEKLGVMLVGRARSRQFQVFSAHDRLIFDVDD